MRNQEEQLEYYRTAVAYWQTYAKNFEKHISNEEKLKKVQVESVLQLQEAYGYFRKAK